MFLNNIVTMQLSCREMNFIQIKLIYNDNNELTNNVNKSFSFIFNYFLKIDIFVNQEGSDNVILSNNAYVE